jgi:hypothetical protein
MGKKPKSAGHAMMIRNAKKKKVSKNPYVRYPDAEGVKALLGIRVNDTQK